MASISGDWLDEGDWWEYLQRAVASQDGDKLDSALFDLEITRLTAYTFPEEDFQKLLQILEYPDFLQMVGTDDLIACFERESDILNDDQISRIVAAYEKAYPHINEWFGQFAVSERMSSICHDKRALAMWRHLMDVKDEKSRSCVPHGLEHLVKEGDDVVSRDAMELLLNMREDPSDWVRAEVQTSLERLKWREQVADDEL